jgi:hypothetical protein
MASAAVMGTASPKQPRASAAVKWRDQTIVGLLETIQRERDLRDEESALMERTVRRLTPRREVWRWTHAEDMQLLPIIRRIKTLGPRPFRRNDEIRQLAQKMGRTEWAVIRRMERLRKRMKCSNAKSRAKG